MRRALRSVSAGALVCALAVFSATAATPRAASAADAPPSDWQRRFDEAGRKLVNGDSAGAAADFAALAAEAPSDTARSVALDQLRVASEAARKKGQLPSTDLSGAPLPPPSSEMPPPMPAPSKGPRMRTGDELVVLLGTAPAYGVATGFFLDSLLIRRRNSPTSGVPLLALGITGFAGLSIAMLEYAGKFRYGVPQSISTGIVMGAAEGISIATFAVTSKNGNSDYGYRTFTSLTWGFATAGGIAGGILGSTMTTSPGRSAWVGTTGLVTGLLAGGIAGAATPKDVQLQFHNFGITSAIGGAVGLGVGFATAGLIGPSMARVRYVDLAWFSGGAIGVGTCVATAKCSSAAAFSALTIGTVIGFAAGFFGTWGMGRETLPGEAQPPPKGLAAVLDHASPYVSPAEYGGLMFGVGGAL